MFRVSLQGTPPVNSSSAAMSHRFLWQFFFLRPLALCGTAAALAFHAWPDSQGIGESRAPETCMGNRRICALDYRVWARGEVVEGMAGTWETARQGPDTCLFLFFVRPDQTHVFGTRLKRDNKELLHTI
jgi:hypothetical protein